MDAALAVEERLKRPGAMGKLLLFLTDGTMREIPLDRERVTIGRHPTQDVCLPYPAVSGAHAALIALPTGTVLEDLGSTNGTLVNGRRTTRWVLRDRDRIDIGRQQLVFLAEGDAVVPSPTGGAPAVDRRAGAATAPAPDPGTVSPAIVPAEGPHSRFSAQGSSDRLASGAPAATADSWLAPPGRNGAADAGDPAGRARRGTVPSEIATEDSLPGLPATAPAHAGPTLRVVTGPNTGRTLALAKEDVLIGRVGLQVAAIRKDENSFRLFAVDGTPPPYVNGNPVPVGGVLLQDRDAIDIAGARLEFLAPAAPRVAVIPGAR